jgi:organic radical activating enzyme
LKISEIFVSIQGEGPTAGKPAVFLRTSMCNLTCSWCDTKYTWDWQNFDYNKEVKEMSINDIKEKITESWIKHLVITGGEPLLQQDELCELLEILSSLKFYVEVETNCTIKPTVSILEHVNQWNVSPKTKNSQNKLELYENSECYNFFSKLDNSIFKFVVENESDMEEIEHLIIKFHLPRERVLLMPQASGREELLQCRDTIQEISKKHNLGFTNRLQVEQWGNQRGK